MEFDAVFQVEKVYAWSCVGWSKNFKVIWKKLYKILLKILLSSKLKIRFIYNKLQIFFIECKKVEF